MTRSRLPQPSLPLLTPLVLAHAGEAGGVAEQGGTVQMPPGETFWSKRFAMVQDRRGLGWMIGLPGEEPLRRAGE